MGNKCTCFNQLQDQKTCDLSGNNMPEGTKNVQKSQNHCESVTNTASSGIDEVPHILNKRINPNNITAITPTAIAIILPTIFNIFFILITYLTYQ